MAALGQVNQTVNVNVQPASSNNAALLDRIANPTPVDIIPNLQRMQAMRYAQQEQALLKIRTEQEQLRLTQMRQQQYQESMPRVSLPASTPLPNGTVHIQDTMTVSDFQKAGLPKLSDDEIQALNVWLTAKIAEVVASVNSQKSLRPSLCN